MPQGDHYFVVQFFDKFFCALHVGSQSYYFYHAIGCLIAFAEKFYIRFADISFHMGAFFRRIQERSLHIDTYDMGTGVILFYICCCLENSQQFFFRKSHGCRAVGSHAL